MLSENRFALFGIMLQDVAGQAAKAPVPLRRNRGLSFFDRSSATHARENAAADQASSKRSAFITLDHAATKSFTNFSFASAQA